ncbi:MAG: acetyl-CoA carboxylase biotin carboxyl carrier protein [Myxococcota bacterium]
MGTRKSATKSKTTKSTPSKKRAGRAPLQKSGSSAGRKAAPRTPTKAEHSPSTSDVRAHRFREIVGVFNASGLAELEYQDSDITLRISRFPGRSSTPAADSSPIDRYDPAPPVAPAKPPSEPARDLHTVLSPFVGTFYRAPSPEAPPFVDVGQRVIKGQTLCIVEAMKLMNEIPSDVNGSVVEVLVENGEVVQYGDPLFKINAP